LICQWPLSVQAIAPECARTSGCHGLPSREVTRATRPWPARPGVPCSLLQVRPVTGTILLLPARGRSRFRFPESAGATFKLPVPLSLVLAAGEAGPGQVRGQRRLSLSGQGRRGERSAASVRSMRAGNATVLTGFAILPQVGTIYSYQMLLLVLVCDSPCRSADSDRSY
jgi:hypothetical protein